MPAAKSATKAKKKGKDKRKVRTERFEIYKFCGDDHDRRRWWKELCKQAQYHQNRLWQEWFLWHMQHGSRQVLLDYNAECVVWHKADPKTRGAKPKYPLEAIPDDWNETVKRVSAEFPELHVRCKTLLCQIWRRTIIKRKATNGSISGWAAILLAREGCPQFTKPIPLPFDKVNTKFLPPDEEHKDWRVEVRVQRIEREGKLATAVTDVAQFITRRRKATRQRKLLEKIHSGEYEFKGSKLHFDGRKWYAMISYAQPAKERPKLDTSKTLTLLPGRNDPWVLLCTGENAWFHGGLPRRIAEFRKMVQRRVQERNGQYKVAGSTSKGHGRGRARAPVHRIRTLWRTFVDRYNHEVTTGVVRKALAKGVGRIEYWRPVEERRDERCLAWIGKDSRRGINTSWDFYQVETQLKYKCAQAGIEFSAREFNRKPSGQKA